MFCTFSVNRKVGFKDKLPPNLQHDFIRFKENGLILKYINATHATSVLYILFCPGMLNRRM